MRPIKLTDNWRTSLLKSIQTAAEKMFASYDMEEDMSLDIPVDEISEKKVTIAYTPGAYLKCQELVKTFPGEVGWYGLVNRMNETRFEVYDVLIPDQNVTGATVKDATNNTDWYDSLSIDQLNHLFFHAHSHVNMGTTPSGTDTTFQRNLIGNMGGEGYYIFQIWNKQGDINSFVYDVDNNLFYDRKDVIIEVMDDTYGTLQNFVNIAKEAASKKEPERVVGYSMKSVDEYFPKYTPLTAPATNNDSEPPKRKEGFYWGSGFSRKGYD